MPRGEPEHCGTGDRLTDPPRLAGGAGPIGPTFEPAAARSPPPESRPERGHEMTAHRTARLLLSLLAGLLLAGTVTATAAQAEDGYRFWGYYQWSGSQWAFAQKGSDAVVPKDGAVEGWRYAVGGAKPRVPRAAGDFNAICGTTPAESGKKRVALVIDPGTQADSAAGQAPPAPTGTCVVTDPAATGAKVLAAVGPVRIEKGLTCGINGYPETTCGQPVNKINVPATDAPVTPADPAGRRLDRHPYCDSSSQHARAGQAGRRQWRALGRDRRLGGAGTPACRWWLLPELAVAAVSTRASSARCPPPHTPPGSAPGGLVVVGVGPRGSRQQDSQPRAAGPDPRRSRFRRRRTPR